MDTATTSPATEVVTPEILADKIDELVASHNRILATLQNIELQIGPVLDGMKSSPIGKLMGM